MKSDLQALFAKRLKEEMDERHLSRNALARICKNVGYASISRILSGKQDPTLEMVSSLADAIGLPAWALLTESNQLEQRVIRPPRPPNVVQLPSPYPKIFTKPISQRAKVHASKKKR